MTWLFFFVLSRQCCACGSLLNQGYLTHIDDIITSFQVLVSSPLNVGLLSEAEWRDGSGGGDVCADEDGDDQGLTGRHGSFYARGVTRQMGLAVGWCLWMKRTEMTSGWQGTMATLMPGTAPDKWTALHLHLPNIDQITQDHICNIRTYKKNQICFLCWSINVNLFLTHIRCISVCMSCGWTPHKKPDKKCLNTISISECNVYWLKKSQS